jgi:neuropeptide F receptor
MIPFLIQFLIFQVSSISITAIALDRYHVSEKFLVFISLHQFHFLQLIVGCPAKDNLHMLLAVGILLIIWLIAFLCALPLYIFKTLKEYSLSMFNFHNKIYYCVEVWPTLPYLHGSVYYSLFSLTLQYFIPILVVSFAYFRIYFRLKKRIIVAKNVASVDDRIQARRGRRTKRTNFLLISIAVIFVISWLPLNIYNISADLYYNNGGGMNEIMHIIFAGCHMAGMSSGESN